MSDIIPYIEAHTHLDHYLDDEIESVMQEIASLPCVTWAVSMDIDSWQKTQALARKQPNILPTFGIHPWKAHLYANRLDELDDYVRESAHMGEIGLDFFWVKEQERWPLQITVLDYFLQRAAEQQKIVNLQTKGAEQLVLDKLRQFKVERAIVHWYSGPPELFDGLLRHGCYFTFGVELAQSHLIQELALLRCPADRLLTETDGPSGLQWLTGERGRPTHIPNVLQRLATVQRDEVAALKGQIWENYQRLGIGHINGAYFMGE
jgi:TatD DNase family protein